MSTQPFYRVNFRRIHLNLNIEIAPSKKIKRFVASNSRVRNKFRLNNEISISYLETGILKEHNHLERNNRI